MTSPSQTAHPIDLNRVDDLIDSVLGAETPEMVPAPPPITLAQLASALPPTASAFAPPNDHAAAAQVLLAAMQHQQQQALKQQEATHAVAAALAAASPVRTPTPLVCAQTPHRTRPFTNPSPHPPRCSPAPCLTASPPPSLALAPLPAAPPTHPSPGPLQPPAGGPPAPPPPHQLHPASYVMLLRRSPRVGTYRLFNTPHTSITPISHTLA